MQPRFRAIDPATGKVSEAFVFKPYVSSRALFEPMERGVFRSDEWILPHSDKDPILSQSTGLTDARGNEVFEGDVLIIPVLAKLHKEISEAFRHGDIYVVEWVRYSWLAKTIYGADTRHPYNVGQDGAIIIGNRYQSQSTLEQRAREVMNG